MSNPGLSMNYAYDAKGRSDHSNKIGLGNNCACRPFQLFLYKQKLVESLTNVNKSGECLYFNLENMVAQLDDISGF